MHAPELIVPCHNPEIQTHLLDDQVLTTIRDIMLDPLKLRDCMDYFKGAARPSPLNVTAQLTRLQNRVAAIETEKRRLIDLYAASELSQDGYVSGNMTLDEQCRRLGLKRSELLPLQRITNRST
jgi:hypothetical protein